MRAWMAMATATAMFVGVGVPGTDRVVPLPVYAAEQATDQAAKVLADMRKALGGSKVDTVKALSLAVRFDPSAVPTNVRAGVQPSLEEEEPADTVPVELARNEAQYVWTDARPGVYSLFWDWD